jgi:exonuclease III
MVATSKSDVICLQEIKATEDQILLKLLQMRAIRINIILQQKGYSGVAILSK